MCSRKRCGVDVDKMYSVLYSVMYSVMYGNHVFVSTRLHNAAASA